MKIVFLFILISCNTESSFRLNSRIPNGTISFKDSSQVLVNNKSVGVLTVKNRDSLEFKVEILFKQRIDIPSNSVLAFHENLIGTSFFEIKMGTTEKKFNNNEEIAFIIQSKENPQDSSIKKKGPDLNKLTKPKVVVRN